VGIELLTERYKSQIAGLLSCYGRIIIQGTVPGWRYAQGMTDYFYAQQLRLFDYPKWAQPLREAIRENRERLAASSTSADSRTRICANACQRKPAAKPPGDSSASGFMAGS